MLRQSTIALSAGSILCRDRSYLGCLYTSPHGFAASALAHRERLDSLIIPSDTIDPSRLGALFPDVFFHLTLPYDQYDGKVFDRPDKA